MKRKIITIFVLTLVTIPVLNAVADYNQSANSPIITGPTSGVVGELYEYSILITDPDDDYMRFLEIDFGDGNIIEMNSGYERLWRNGTVLYISHRWQKSDSFVVRARVRDISGEWSGWSDPLVVSISKTKSIIDFNLWFSRLIERYPILEILL